MEFRDVLAALRAATWALVLGLLLGAGLALLAGFLRPPLYTSEAQLFVSSTDGRSTAEAYQGSQLSQQRVTSYAQLLGGQQMAGRAIQRLQLDMSPEELSDRIQATAVPDTVLLDLTVTDPSPQRAQQIAQVLSDEFGVLVQELEKPSTGEVAPVRVALVEPPDLPTSPSSPKYVRDTVLGAVIGLLVASALVILRKHLDRSVRDSAVAEDLVGAPLIGTIVRDPALKAHHLIDLEAANPTAESFRQLRTNLQYLDVDQPPKVLMISSAVPSEGKTTLTVNLARVLAEAGRQVAILETDLRRPRVTRYLGLVGGVGLSNILAGTADLDEVIQTYGDGRLTVVAAGPTPPNPSQLLASGQLFTLVEQLREKNDFVLVDAPPILPVADASGLAPMVDGVVLSVHYATTRKDQLKQVAATLQRVGAKTLGVALNMVPVAVAMGSAYGYQYNSTPDKHKHSE